ncbi:hypothetical protein EPR50_G00021640 [Perca flavescens]|uniref:Matrin-type domain-containing protein n=1 Tax=Perca flavescens TaxID=8167 RepID=A0A484DNJ4_PERFV|nr:hypothetical protein EPR50_G00021640 [Perca flavescens]
MYHHHSQQQGPQPFSNGPRPPHHQPPPNQHQNPSPSNVLSQAMVFQFPRPTQLPDELESALAIRGARDMDHRLIDHTNRPNQHQNQGSGSGISQHGSYGSNLITPTSDNQPGHQQGVDWSNYQPPAKLFANPLPSASHQSQRHQGPQQQPPSSHAGTSIQNWTSPGSDSATSQSRHPHGGGGDGQALYTPESAGSILASFGLSNEDLEVLSHYPDDQLTPDTLPFILRDIQINKSGNQKTVASSSSFSRSHDMSLPPSRSSPLARSRTPEVPSLLTVTQTAGKVIDYGHASRAKDESGTRETFKREPLSSDRTVKMYPSSSSSAPKLDKVERRQIRLEHSESSKHGDRDYRRTSSDHRKCSRSPGREFPSSKSRNLDRDYRREGPIPRPSSETKNNASLRRSLSSSSGSKPRSSKKLPTPTMISDFSAVSPKVYPHTCSLCHIQCDEEKDWVDHINTVNHTAACRDLRNKYPDWKPNLPSRSGRYGSRALWDPKDHSPSHSASRSLSCSPTPSPPHGKHRVGRPHPHRLSTGPYSSHHQPRHQHYTEHSHRLDHSPPRSHLTSVALREHWPEGRDRESSGGSSRSGVKRPYDSTKFSTDIRRHPSSSKAGHTFKHGPLQSSAKMVKSGKKPGTKTTKIGIAKAADKSAKLPPAKKKKKMVTPVFQDLSVADRLVYLTGIPKDASEQEVTDLVGSFGKINNVVLMPCSEEESENSEGQKASVCLVKAEDAQALANSPNLSIRDQQITALKAKKAEAGPSSDNRTPTSGQDKGATGEDPGGDADQKTYNEKGLVLITGCPESDWSENDIINLVKPFGTPSDIIQAPQIGKVLVSVPDTEIAQEMVKIYTFTPAKINNCELKMIHLKQRISLSTPVALYNLLMGSVDPLESPGPVGWNCLLVISNVPNTPTGSSEVQKLVRRFGTVIKTVVLNNMVICEMATAAMALSVYKRFQTFPCIIQNNPLFFSRKPDPKANTQTKVTAYPDSSEDTPANGKGSQAATAGAASADKETSESPLEVIEKAVDGKDEKTKNTEETVGEDKSLEENWSKDDEIKKDKLAVDLSDSLAAPQAEPGADLETDMRDKSAVKTVVETAEDDIDVNAPTTGNYNTPAGEETKTSSSDGQAASRETAIQELPKVTPEMVKALLVECRTRTASNPNNTAASTNGEQGGTQMETEQGEKAAEGTKEPAKNHTEEEVKKQERERKEREARKLRERERRVWEKEERTKRERERDERARREREKREEERRERKRTHRESVSGSRSSCRSEGYKQSSWRDELYNNSEAETEMVEKKEEEEEEEFGDFPFNMSDFVTVDEVGDVADLPCSSPSPSVPMEATDGGEDAPTSFQQDTLGDTPVEVTPESTMSDAPATLVKSEHVSESEPVAVPIAETLDGLVSSDSKPRLTEIPPQTDIKTETQIPPQTAIKTETQIPPQTEIKTETQIKTETRIPPQTDIETDTEARLDSTTEVEPLLEPAPAASAAPADSSSNSPAAGVVTSENERENDVLNYSQVKKEEMVSDKTEEKEKMQVEEDKETGALAGETVKRKRSEDQTNAEEESVKMKLKTATPMSTDSLPPFDPSSPVGMEFLVPKTGFFCKVCNRFFSGTKEAEINHCKTLKHYENLQKYLQTTKTVTVKPEPI